MSTVNNSQIKVNRSSIYRSTVHEMKNNSVDNISPSLKGIEYVIFPDSRCKFSIHNVSLPSLLWTPRYHLMYNAVRWPSRPALGFANDINYHILCIVHPILFRHKWRLPKRHIKGMVRIQYGCKHLFHRYVWRTKPNTHLCTIAWRLVVWKY